jgi:uncharacterized membrane-anchored protein YhcB (DUF1043 family)
MKKLRQNKKTRTAPKMPRRHLPARAELEEELSEVIQHRAAISEVLRSIARSPHDLQPILDTILDSATRLCRAEGGQFSALRGRRAASSRGERSSDNVRATKDFGT